MFITLFAGYLSRMACGWALDDSVPGKQDPIEAARKAYRSGDHAGAARMITVLAEQGNPEAQGILGILYETGHGVEKDFSQARFWLRKGAEQGDARAQYRLGETYRARRSFIQRLPSGKDWPPPWGTFSTDPKEAVRWYAKAVEQRYVPALYEMANCWFEGDGVKVDASLGRSLLVQAAELGHRLACYFLAIRLENGDGMAKDLEKAVFWYRRAARKEVEFAQERLIELLSGDQSVTPDPIERCFWLLVIDSRGKRRMSEREAELVKSLDPADLAEIQARVREFLAAPVEDDYDW